MNIDQSRIDDLAARPSESLNVEIKTWISPDEPEGIAKIVKAAQAIRNRNGGFLLIGFDNKTLLPDQGRPGNLRDMFHLDKVQGVISKYSSQRFEINVGFANKRGDEFPVIIVPDGVLTPVAALHDLKDSNGKFLIKEGDVYFRTLQSNGTPSTARVHPKDWPEIFEICFQNREADIGLFIRRHLAGSQIERLLQTFSNLRMPVPATLQERSKAVMDDGRNRLSAALESRALPPNRRMSPGAWRGR